MEITIIIRNTLKDEKIEKRTERTIQTRMVFYK